MIHINKKQVYCVFRGAGNAGSDAKKKVKDLVERMSYMELTAEDLDGINRIGAGAFERHAYLSKITLPNTITSIEGYAFEASSITDIVIPDKCTVLKACAFNICSSLKSIDLGNGVQTIGDQCFGYSKLRTITFPASLKTLGNNMFYQNQNYTESLTFKGTTPPTISVNSLSGLKADCVIFVPAEAVTEYKIATNWSVRANYIYPIGYEPSVEMCTISLDSNVIGIIETLQVPKGMNLFTFAHSDYNPYNEVVDEYRYTCENTDAPLLYNGAYELYTEASCLNVVMGNYVVNNDVTFYFKA